MSDGLEAVLGIAGTLAGTYLGHWFGSRGSRNKAALATMNAFNSVEMIIMREKAVRFLRGNPTKTLGQIDEELHPDSTGVWAVLNFFARIQLEIELHEIYRKRVPEIFGGLVVWWWEVHFKGRLTGEDWSAYNALEKLQAWIELESRRSGQTERFQKWVKKAQKARIKCYGSLNPWPSESAEPVRIPGI